MREPASRWARLQAVALCASLATAPLMLAGCKEEGPIEKAGRKVDEAVDKVTHPNEGPIEKAGRKVDETYDKVAKKIKKAFD